jgi:hypothetical protein
MVYKGNSMYVSKSPDEHHSSKGTTATAGLFLKLISYDLRDLRDGKLTY